MVVLIGLHLERYVSQPRLSTVGEIGHWLPRVPGEMGVPPYAGSWLQHHRDRH